MQVEKSILIPNTANDHVATTTIGTTISQAIEDNVKALSRNSKQLQEQNTHLEQEKSQLKAQLGTSKTLMFALDDFKKCALE